MDDRSLGEVEWTVGASFAVSPNNYPEDSTAPPSQTDSDLDRYESPVVCLFSPHENGRKVATERQSPFFKPAYGLREMVPCGTPRSWATYSVGQREDSRLLGNGTHYLSCSPCTHIPGNHCGPMFSRRVEGLAAQARHQTVAAHDRAGSMAA